MNNKVFGGIAYEEVASINPFMNGYVATGISSSDTFTEGACTGRKTRYGDVFISYFDYWPVVVPSITPSPVRLLCYPNPTQNSIRIILPKIERKEQLIITNNNGAVVYEKDCTTQTTYADIDTKLWHRGTYIATLRDSNGISASATFVCN